MPDTDIDNPAPACLLDRLYTLVAEGRSRRAVSVTFAVIDDALLAGHFAEVDALLPAIDLDRLDLTSALGVASITYSATEYLPSRPAMIERMRAWIRVKDPDRAEALMRGL